MQRLVVSKRSRANRTKLFASLPMYSLIKDILQPFPLLLFWFIAVFLLLLRKPVPQRRWRGFLAPLILLYLTSTPLCVFLAAATLEWHFPQHRQLPDEAEAIVVLSGYYYSLDDEGKDYELGEDTLYRCLKAEELYHQGRPCPVFVSGGVLLGEEGTPSCGELMKGLLIRNGVNPADVVVEGHSQSTHENAVESARLLKEKQIKTIVLITDAIHLPRAIGCFRKAGFNVIPCGCRLKANSLSWSVTMVLPSPHAARDFQDVWYEWLGLSWYWFRGRI